MTNSIYIPKGINVKSLSTEVDWPFIPSKHFRVKEEHNLYTKSWSLATISQVYKIFSQAGKFLIFVADKPCLTTIIILYTFKIVDFVFVTKIVPSKIKFTWQLLAWYHLNLAQIYANLKKNEELIILYLPFNRLVVTYLVEISMALWRRTLSSITRS